jgi:cytosine/creatinine deaminase
MDQTPFFCELRKAIASKGGLFNAHLHLDRAGTLKTSSTDPDEDISSLSLAAKHGLIPAIHASIEYDEDRLAARGASYLDHMVSAGTSRAATCVDVTADRVGLTALKVFLQLKRSYAKKLDLQVGAYSPLGFKTNEPDRWQLLASGARNADFIGSLPERDDQRVYPDHIGFEQHCVKIITLSQELQKSVHMHIDQRNDPREDGSERVIKTVRQLGLSFDRAQEPLIWLVHLISPSSYDEPRFQKLLSSLVEFNIGLICCPSAAISMRQLRPIVTPTHNSLPRILEMLAAGIHVRLGSDNICDITSPAGTCDLENEVFLLANALRYYDIDILSTLAVGIRLDAKQCARIKDHLAADGIEVAKAITDN